MTRKTTFRTLTRKAPGLARWAVRAALPDGVFDMSNGRGGYRVRCDSRRATTRSAQIFASEICGHSGRSAAGLDLDPGRPVDTRPLFSMPAVAAPARAFCARMEK